MGKCTWVFDGIFVADICSVGGFISTITFGLIRGFASALTFTLIRG